MSQSEFSSALGISRNYLSMIEGGREPSRRLIAAIETMEARANTLPETIAREKSAEAKLAHVRDVLRALLQALES